MEGFKIQNLKGTVDYLNNEQIARNKIIDILKNIFESYGYMPIDTPILNKFDLLSYKYAKEKEILTETYRLKDQGNRDLGLRYDLTIPFCKVIALNKNLKMPFKRYEIGKVFRNGPVKTGRMREFYQCDVDCVGIDNRYIEIEQMIMALKVFEKLNIDIVIKWNNRKLMSGLIIECGIEEEKIDKVISIIDHMEKISKNEMIDEFNKIGIPTFKSKELLSIFEKNINEYNNIYKNTNNNYIKEGLFEINETISLINKFDLNEHTLFSPTLARGLSIYTGLVFEFFDKEKRLTCSLGGGGRYNKIITDFINDGNKYPACGLSFGLEPIYTILKEKILSNNIIKCLIIPMDTMDNSLLLATTLRDHKINVIVDMKNKKIKKSFAFADKEKIKYVIFVGTDEINLNKYTLKNMETGKQEILDINQIIEKLK